MSGDLYIPTWLGASAFGVFITYFVWQAKIIRQIEFRQISNSYRLATIEKVLHITREKEITP